MNVGTGGGAPMNPGYQATNFGGGDRGYVNFQS